MVDSISDEMLGRLGMLAAKQLDLEKQLAEAEEEVKNIKKALARVSEVDIPTLLEDEIGLSSVETVTGEKVTVKEVMTASIAKKNKMAAIKWLEQNNLGSLVQNDVVIPFKKGDEEASVLAAKLKEEGYGVVVEPKVNTGSVKSAVKDLMEENKSVPLELFGIQIVRKSVIK